MFWYIFEMLFDCFISYLYMRVLKLTLGNFCFAYFPLLFSLQCEASGRTCSCVRTRSALSISYLTACRPDEYVPHPDASFLLSLPNIYITFCLFYHDVLCVFSLELIPRFWHSLHIFSHS